MTKSTCAMTVAASATGKHISRQPILMEYGGMFGSLVEYVGDSEVSSIRLSSFLYLLRRMNYSYCLDLAFLEISLAAK